MHSLCDGVGEVGRGRGARGRARGYVFSLVIAGLLTASGPVAASSLNFVANTAGNHEYGRQPTLPSGFGSGEFTLELWVRPDTSFPVGPQRAGTSDQLRNWITEDASPYSSGSWWWPGNFLLDGHNNNSFEKGTFSLQFYGGGRVRWDFGDGTALSGGHWSVQAWPASSTNSLLDGRWHQVTCVRRWSGATSATLELWVDGALVADEVTGRRTNMWTQYWSAWGGYPSGQAGWFWGAEKQAAVGLIPQYEDYKGLVDEVRFWSRAKTQTELQTDWMTAVSGQEAGLIGLYGFGESAGASTCNDLSGSNCITLIKAPAAIWNSADAPVDVSAGVPPPVAPSSLAASASSTQQIDLGWGDVSGETGYCVERSTDGTSFVAVASPGAGVVSFSDVGLNSSTTHYYRVKAVNSSGDSPYSGVASATTLSPAPPPPSPSVPTTPGTLSAIAVSSQRIDLAWGDSSGETSYSVERSTGGAAYRLLTTLNADTVRYADTGLVPATAYSYVVRAHNAEGPSAYSNEARASTSGAPAPEQPANLSAVALSSSEIRLNWSDVPYETRYTIERSRDLAQWELVATLGAGTVTYTDRNLDASTRYYYSVQAHNDAGSSWYSDEATALTFATDALVAPSAPSSLSATRSPSRTITLTWIDNSSNEAGFKIERSGSGLYWNQIATVVMDQTTFSTAEPRYGRRYYYRIRAYNAEGNSPYSNVAAVQQ